MLVADRVEMTKLKALLLRSTQRSAERAYVTASEIVLLAEMLGSTSTSSSTTGLSSTGSALLSDMTARKQLLLGQSSVDGVSCLACRDSICKL